MPSPPPSHASQSAAPPEESADGGGRGRANATAPAPTRRPSSVLFTRALLTAAQIAQNRAQDHGQQQRHLFVGLHVGLSQHDVSDAVDTDYTHWVELPHFSWDLDVLPLKHNNAAGQAARASPLGLWLWHFAELTALPRRMYVRRKAATAEACVEAAWASLVDHLEVCCSK